MHKGENVNIIARLNVMTVDGVLRIEAAPAAEDCQDTTRAEVVSFPCETGNVTIEHRFAIRRQVHRSVEGDFVMGPIALSQWVYEYLAVHETRANQGNNEYEPTWLEQDDRNFEELCISDYRVEVMFEFLDIINAELWKENKFGRVIRRDPEKKSVRPESAQPPATRET